MKNEKKRSILKTIVLASQSPRRKQLLNLLYPDFICHPAHIDEDIPYEGNPDFYCENLALQKAKEVASNYSNALIIGSDTIVILNNKSLGKPETKEHAIQLLTELSGNSHDVFTGVAIISHDKEVSFSVRTKVKFHPLTHEEIVAYVKTGSPMDKAGGYGIQDDWGAVFVAEISGDYYNVVGFPLQAFYSKVKIHFPEYLPHARVISK